MKVNEYIYRNWANWNFAILKELCEDEGIEWSEELVGYLKTTPTNTNWSLLKDFGIEPYSEEEEDSNMVTITFIENEEWKIIDFNTHERISSPYILTVPIGSTITVPDIEYSGTRPHSGTSTGWYNEEEEVTNINPGESYIVDSNITVYANGEIFN